MAWTKDNKKGFRLALQDVYRDYSSLEIFVADGLGWSLPTIASSDQDLNKVAFALIKRAEAKGRLDALYEDFRRENPGHIFQVQPKIGTRGGRATGTKTQPPIPQPPTPGVQQTHRSRGDNVAGNKQVNHYHSSRSTSPNTLSRGRFLKYGGAGVAGVAATLLFGQLL